MAEFPPREFPTKPNSPEARASALVRSWRELPSEQHRMWVEKLLDFMTHELTDSEMRQLESWLELAMWSKDRS